MLPMRASDQLLDYLKRREAFSATPYADSAGLMTIGYGHLMTRRERETLTRCTEDQAAKWLATDVSARALWLAGINANLPTPLNQHQFDAVLSWAYNVGLTAAENSTLMAMLRQANFAGAANQFDRWIYITRGKKVALKGLINRRRMDRAIFERGIYA